MGIGDKMENIKDQVVGQVKQTVGDAKDDPEMQAEGKAQETKGDAKQTGEKVKDTFS